MIFSGVKEKKKKERTKKMFRIVSTKTQQEIIFI